jgi:hypothetical protein
MAWREREVRCDQILDGGGRCPWTAKTYELYMITDPETTPRVIHGHRDEKGLLRDAAGQPVAILSRAEGMGDHGVVFEKQP